MPPCAFDKKTAPGIIQTEPLQSRITGRPIRNLQQSMPARACRLRAIPFEQRAGWSADANRAGEQTQAHRAPVLVGNADLGLTGDPLGLALGLIWAELLGLTVFLAWRYRHRWSPEVLYLLTAPIVLILAVLTFSSLDLMLPGTF